MLINFLSLSAASRLDSKLQGSTGSVGSGVSGISASGSVLQRHYIDHIPATTETQALKEAHNKYHLLQSDYKTLHDKRLQDVSVAILRLILMLILMFCSALGFS